ncbi:MAG: hypothetical protein ACLRSY_05630 [Acutalibacter sp.]
MSIEKMHEETMIDCWFLSKILNLLNYERELAKGRLTQELYTQGSWAIPIPPPRLSGCEVTGASPPSRWWTPAPASSPPTLLLRHLRHRGSRRRGQALQVHRRKPLKADRHRAGLPHPHQPGHRVRLRQRPCVMSCSSWVQVVIINNNPETVSTDFGGDRLC